MELNKNNLEEKLEGIKPLNIEVLSHKENLKRTLINWKYGNGVRQHNLVPFLTFKKLAFSVSSLAIILILVFGVNMAISPQLTLAEVREIALKDVTVKKLISEGNQIQDIKIVDKNGYVLITSSEKITSPEQTPSASMSSNESNKTITVLAQISFKDKKVVDIKNIEPAKASLNEDQKNEAKNILVNSQNTIETTSKSNIEIKSIVPVSTSTSKLEITIKNGAVEVAPTTEKVIIQYQSDSQQKEAQVNMTSQQVESTKTIESNSQVP